MGSLKMAEGEINIDNIIQRLLEVRGSRPGKTVQMTEAEVRGLCLKSRELFLQQPILLELEASPRRPTISSWETMWTEESRAWRPSACSWPTRSNTPRTSSCCAATTSVPRSTGYTDSTMSASGGTTSSCGKPSRTASTVSQSQL